MGELDHLEELAVVEVRLRDDQLVHGVLGQGPRQVSGLDRADELVADAAPALAEGPAEVADPLGVSHEDRPAPHARHAHDVAGNDLVARPKQPDEEPGEHDRGRGQAIRSELTVRPDAVDDADEPDEDQRPDDPAAAAATLALGVEPGAPEDEDEYQGEERQPLGLRPPQRSPEDLVAVVDRAEDERAVEPEDQPAEVERDQREDAEHTADERRHRAAEDERARRTDVADGGRRGVPRRFFGCHGATNSTLAAPWPSLRLYLAKVWNVRYDGFRAPRRVMTPDCQPLRRPSSRIRNHTNMSIRRVFLAIATACFM